MHNAGLWFAVDFTTKLSVWSANRCIEPMNSRVLLDFQRHKAIDTTVPVFVRVRWLG